MFQHLEIKNIKALRECELRDLGKINVLCGKNNSGKSTVLEGISDKTKRFLGVTLGDEQVNSIHTACAELASRYSLQGPETLSQKLLRVLHETAQSKSIWYADSGGSFATDVCTKMDFAAARQTILNIWEKLYEDSERTALLSPKRRLELTQAVNSTQEALPHGEGVLNQLFYTKNQDRNSDIKKNYEQLIQAFSDISSGYSFDIFLGPSNKISLSFAQESKPFINAQDCGLGLQDLLVILFFSFHPNYSVILIEEPESHLHPEMQKKLLYFLRNGTDKQIFLTTHSNVFLNNALVNRVFFTSFVDSVNVDDATSRASILDDLGYSVADNLVSDLVILVEGPKDVPVIEEFLIKLDLDKTFDIKIWPLGGDIMGQVDLSIFAQNYSIIALIDQDPGSESVRRRFIRNCEDNDIPVHRLQRYAIENYFTLRALRQVFSIQIPADITEIDPNKKLENQIGLDVKRTNRRVAKAMSIDEIRDTDLFEFFSRVREKCSES